MVKQSIIVKLGLESRTRELYDVPESTYRTVADALSKESGHNITKDIVFKFLKADEKTIAKTIEKKAELQTKAAEIEINTIDDRLDDIKFLSDLAADAQSAGDYRAAAMAMKIKNETRDSIDKRLGRITNNPNVQINNINAMRLSDIPTDQLRRIIDEARSMSAQ
jgi:hypothetical protein